MSVAAVMLVKDEADIVETTVRHLLTQVDEVFVQDNLSTDGTREILAELALDGRVMFRDDPEVGYWQARKTTALAREALECGHDWVLPCDADEIWIPAAGGSTIAAVLGEMGGEVGRVGAAVLNHYATGDDAHHEPNPVRRIRWRTAHPLGLPKTAARLHPEIEIHAGNHNATASWDSQVWVEGRLEVHHFPYRSADQFVRKAVNGCAAYRQTDLPRGTGQHWREYGEMIEDFGEDAGREWFRHHFYYPDPLEDGRTRRTDLAPLVYEDRVVA